MKNYKALQNGSDIRGVALDTVDGQPVNLTDAAARDLSYGFVQWLSKKTGKAPEALKIAVGRDSRISGLFLQMNVCNALAICMASVLDCGMASTPAMFMATVFEESDCDGAIMITASHLPSNRNGFKYFSKDGGLEKADITEIIGYAQECETPYVACGECSQCSMPETRIKDFDLMAVYCAHLRKIIASGLNAKEEDKPLAGLHVVVDAGNGAGGFYADKVLAPLGADVSGSQFLEPDGSFPNHQPNPENKAAMESISSAVKAAGADLGIIFDTDVDRSAAVDQNGTEIARNGIVALAAALVAEDFPGSTVVTDSITSTQLAAFLNDKLGLKHLRFKRGYRNVINKGIELNAAGTECHLAIETSGHAAIKENYFLDDGAYLATKIVVKAAQLRKEGKYIDSMLSGLEEPKEAVEYRMNVTAEDFADYAGKVLDELKAAVEAGVPGFSLETPNYEGVRVNVSEEYGDGWFLIRKSLHDPLMPLNIESNKEGGAAAIAGAIKAMLEKYDGLDTSIL